MKIEQSGMQKLEGQTGKWEASFHCYIVRKVICTQVPAKRRLDSLLDSDFVAKILLLP